MLDTMTILFYILLVFISYVLGGVLGYFVVEEKSTNGEKLCSTFLYSLLFAGLAIFMIMIT